ncbi:MAG: PAS domain S-box protein [Methanoregula sp.]|nr:PAS domain S-box protein [Methanoregula sp.]
MIDKPFRDNLEYFHAFIRTAQYIPNLTSRQDIFAETGRVLVSFYGADLVGFFEPGKDGGIEGHHWILPDNVPGTAVLTRETEKIIAGVLETGFLAAQRIDIPEPFASVFLPILWENQTAAVMLVGHRTSDPIPKELLNIYLAVAGIVSNAITGADAEFKNIVARKHAEEALKEARAQLAFLVSHTPVVLYRFSASDDFKVTFISDNVRQQMGYEAHEFMDDPAFWHDHIHPDDRKHVFRGLPRRVEKGTITSEYRFLTKDGIYRWTRDEVRAVRDVNGMPVEYLGYWIDITERKIAEEKLEYERKQLLSLFSSIDEIIYVCDPYTYEILYVNDALLRAFQKNPVGGICYKEFQGFYHPCEFCTNEILLKNKYKPYRWEYHNPLINRDFEMVDRIIKWPDGRDVRFEFAKDITERKKAEESLRESEEKFREIFENANDAIEIIELLDSGRPGKYLDLNTVACRMVQHTKEELLQHSPLEIDTGTFSRSFEEILRELHTDDHATFEAEHRRKDGIIVPVEVNAHIVTLLGKRVILSIVRDITERKRVEEALRIAHEKYTKAFLSAPNAITISELDSGRFIEVNDAATRIFGYSRDELIGKSAIELGIWLNKEERDHFIDQIRKHGKVSQFEVLERRKSGDLYYARVNADTISIGNITCIIAIIHDITDQKNAEAALRESEKRFRNLFETTSDLVWEVDETGHYTYVSPKVLATLGYTPDELRGKTPFDVMPPEEAARVGEIFSKIIASQQPFSSLENSSLHKDGYIVILDTSGVPVFRPDGTFCGFRGIDRDITARKRAEEAVQAAVKLHQLIDTMSISESMGYTLDEAERLTTSKIGFFHFVNPDEQTIQLITWSTETRKHCFIPKEPERNYPMEKAGIWVDCLRERKPVIHNDYASLPYKKGLPKGHVPVIRELVVPIFEEDKIIAIIGVGNKATDYDERDVNVLTLLAKNAWTLIQRKRAEEALRESRQILEAVLNTITVRVFWKDKNLVYLGCNTSFARDAGFEKPEDIIGKDDYAMGWREQAELYRGDDRAVIESGQHKLLFEEPQTTPSGQKIYLLTSKVPLRDASGEIIGVLGTYLDITARKYAEDALKESEERYRTILEQATDAVFIHDETGCILDVNRKACQSLGYTREELLSKSIGDIDPDVIQSEKDKLWGKVITGEHFTFESRQRRKDGCMIPVEVSLGSVHLPDGLVIISSVRDITDRKKAEEEERLTRERFETLVNVSEMRDASETELSEYVMEAACRMTGSTLAFIGAMTPDESVMDIISWSKSTMQDCRIAVSPIHFPVQKAGIWADAIRTQTPKIVNDYSVHHPGKKGLPEGHVRITRFLSLPILDNGKVVMVAAVANKPEEYDDADVTRLMLLMQGVWGNLQRRRSEDALKKSEEMYRVLFEESPISLFEEDFSDIKVWIDTKTNEDIGDFRTWLECHPEDVAGCAIMVNVTHINRATMALFGAASHKEFSEGLSRIFTKDSYDAFKEELIALAEGKNEFEGEVQIQTLNGERKTVLQKMTVVPGCEQTFSKILVSIIDITDLKRVEGALRQANKQLNILSSVTRHDILNQLLALKGYLELSQDIFDDPKTLSEYIQKEQHIANTIDRQITFTRNYQELGVAAPAWQNVNANIKSAIMDLPMRAVRVDVDRTDLEIFADRLFEKVFYNLFDNALKYGGDQMTTIRISSQESDTYLVIVCEDNGVGITDEDKKHLFTRGFGKHTGLGLFLSREILAVTGITIIENGVPGKGARFEITVPKGEYRINGSKGK